MKVILKIDGKQRTFFSRTPSMEDLRKLMELQTRIDLNFIIDLKDLDEVINLILDLFYKQFTFDQLCHGIASHTFMSETIPNYVADVNGVLSHGDGSKKKYPPKKTTSGSKTTTGN